MKSSFRSTNTSANRASLNSIQGQRGSCFSLSSGAPYSRVAGLFVMLLASVFCAVNAIAQGALTNGANHTGTLVVGTTNTYTFSATAGDSFVLRIGTTNFTPRLVVFGPGGVSIGSAAVNSGLNHDVMLSLRTTNSGTFTVAVSSFYAGGSGTYGLRFGQIPGD